MELTTVRIAVPVVLSAASAPALSGEVARALNDDSVGILVLEGGADGFCRGMDIDALACGSADSGSGVRSFAEALCLLAEAGKPTLAVVRGAALGGGLGIAAVCDLVIADRSATFGLPEALFGLTPAVITPILLERMSAAQLRRLVLTAEPIGADEARLVGLVDEVLDEAAIATRTRRLCTALSRVQPGTKRALAEAVGQHRRGSVRESVQWGVAETTRATESVAVATRIRRFLEGAAPWEA